jgi:hypothetical protein
MAASATAAVICAFAGSYLGRFGTFGALVIGSFLSGGLTWWGERAIRKSAALAREKTRFTKIHDRPPTTSETQMLARVVERKHCFPALSWRRIVILGAAACVLGMGVLTTTEWIAGRPASAIVQGKPGHGLSLDGGSPVTPAASTPAPSAPATLVPPSVTATVTASASPTTPEPSSPPAASPEPPSSSSPGPASPGPVPSSMPGTAGSP